MVIFKIKSPQQVFGWLQKQNITLILVKQLIFHMSKPFSKPKPQFVHVSLTQQVT